MRILIVSQYFYPENFKFNDLAEDLSIDNDVTVLAGIPNYPMGDYYDGYGLFSPFKEKYNKVTIYRSPLVPRKKSKFFLALNYITFPIFSSIVSLYLILTQKKFDKILVCQVSPIFMVLPAILIRKITDTPVYLWITDLWPESLSATGAINNQKILALVSVFVSWTYNNVDKILISCRGFEKSIREKCPKASITYFPYWAEEFYKPVIPNKKFTYPNKFKLMFAGNIGEAQNLKLLVEAVSLIKDVVDLCVIIVGDGRNKDVLLRHISKANLESHFIFSGSFPPEEMPGILSHADALYLSLRDDPIFTITIPSKLQSYMACEKPIIGSIEGEAADVITNSGCGFVSSPSNVFELSINIKRMANMSQTDRRKLAQAAKVYYEKHFSREIAMKSIRSIFQN